MVTLPSFYTYCKNTTAVNAQCFSLGYGLSVYFSYKTPIAYTYDSHTVVRENDWSTTTGKHLNAIDGGDKKSRISGKQFEKQLADIMNHINNQES